MKQLDDNNKIIVSILKCVFFGMWTNIIKDGDVNKII